METLKTFWHWLTTSRYTRFLEEENARLRAMIEERTQRPAVSKKESSANAETPRHHIRSWARMRQQLESGIADPATRMDAERHRRVAARLAVEE